ncbi:hypothetical protein HNS38_15830 [Lentimicrobium sp. L6]|nr:hypothetical protein [Lentimicrobium sp. L6]NPD86243.1 hypothetical protein [Lentimicrobium sp. L6]
MNPTLARLIRKDKTDKNKMKPRLLIILLMLTTIIVAQNTSSSITGKNISEVLDDFIEEDKNSGPFFYSYSVFVISAYHSLDDDSKDTCFTMGVIRNESYFDLVMPEYFCHYNDELIVFVFYSGIKPYDISGFTLKPIDNDGETVILKKLYPKTKGFISGTDPGLLIKKKNNKLHITKYVNSDEIPENKSIIL